jgi:1-acyl-sn-glycerol-3-phosphate acyltransferase
MPGAGPVIFTMKHESLLDVPIAVAASPRPVTFMAERELFRNRVGAKFLHELGGFSVDRDSFDLRSIRTALAVLARGEVLGMYPEGTRRPGELLPFLDGAAWLALRTGAPLLPAAIKGTEAAMPPGRKIPKRVPVEVIFDRPIPVERVEDPVQRRAEAGELTARLRAVFEHLLR